MTKTTKRTTQLATLLLGILAAGPAWSQGYPVQYPAAPEPAPYGYPAYQIARPPTPPPPREVEDPARNRLSLVSTAELLEQGEWAMTCRGLVTLEFAYGARDWLELGFKNIPLLLVVPEGPKNTLWSFGARFRLAHNPLFTLTADTDAVFFLGWGGAHARLSLKLGNDRIALHAGASGIRLWQVSADGWAAEGPSCAPDGECGKPARDFFVGTLGTHLRVHRKVKLMLEATSMVDLADDHESVMLISPAVRLHGHHFAADLGISFVHEVGRREVYMVPLVNLSVRY